MKRYFKTLLGVAVGAVLSLDAAAALAQTPAARIHSGPAASVRITKGASVRDLYREHFEQVQSVHMVMHHCIAKGMETRHPGLEFDGMMDPGFDPYFMPAPGDLELLGVHLVGEGEQGPLYQVSLRNNSSYPVRGFSVSLIAALGELEFDSPIVTLDIKELASGDIATVEIQLPAEALAMGSRYQPLVPFDTLYVAIDSFDELMETNELNNVARLIRTEIAAIAVETANPAQAEAVAPVGPEAEAAPGPAAAPAGPAAPAPTDEIDFDSLSFGAQSDAPATSAPAQAETSEAVAGDAAPSAPPAAVEGNGEGPDAGAQGGTPNPFQPEAAHLFIR